MTSIKIIKIINEFSYRNSFSDIENKLSLVEQEIQFPPKSKQKIIDVKDSEENISFFLSYYGDETKHFIFREGFFEREELIELGKIFNFKTIIHPYTTDLLIGSLGFKNEEYKNQCYGAITKKNFKFYLVIFAYRGLTTFEDNIFYIHGIWQIELSKLFKNKIYPHAPMDL